MIVLGIDPGTLVTGYGVIERTRTSLVVRACGVIRNKADEEMPLRLKRIYDGLCEIIRHHRPEACAIESAFYGKNVQSTLKIGYARGAAMLAAVQYDLTTSEYSPREVKKSVAGNGAASKEQVQYMIRSLLKLKKLPEPLDASDALAVSLCHLNHGGPASETPRKRRESWSDFAANHPERIVRQR